MAPRKTDPSAADTRAPAAATGTENMGYWDFRKTFCSGKGWQLRRRQPQTYDVLDGEGRKVGVFKSKMGFFPG